MKRVLLAAAALAVLAAQPASAQFYGGGPYGGGGQYYEEDEDVDYAPRRSYRRYYEERDAYRPRRMTPSRRAQLGSVCVTARGNCDAGMVAPRNSPCRCFIPGFGPKRGAIGY